MSRSRRMIAGAVVASTVLAAPAAAAERELELVSPPDGGAYPTTVLPAPTGSDDVFIMTTGSPSPLREDGGSFDILGAHRSAQGWVTSWLTDYSTPSGLEWGAPRGTWAGRGASDGRRIFLETGDDAVTEDTNNPSGNYDAFYSADYYVMGAGAQHQLLSQTTSGGSGPGKAPAFGEAGPYFFDPASLNVANDDLSAAVFLTKDQLDPVADTDAEADVYVNRNGVVELVSQKADGAPDPGTSTGAWIPLARYGHAAQPTGGPLSVNGSRVMFESTDALDVDDTDTEQDVYLRAGGDTLLVSGTQRTPADTAAPVMTAGTSADLSVVYLQTSEQLVDADVDAGTDVYRYAVGTGDLEIVSGGGGAGEDAPANGVAFSADGEVAFFTSTDRLSPDAPPGAEPVLYVWDGTLRAIGIVDPSDADEFGDRTLTAYPMPLKRPARVSADGSALVFETLAPLAGDADGSPDVFVWRDGDGVTCVSCSPLDTGGAESRIGLLSEFAEGNPFNALGVGGVVGRVWTADEETIFFSSAEALTDDANAGGMVKVYEFSAASGLNLVAQGTTSNVNYADSSPDGRTVWVTTADALIPQLDVDTGYIDVYAAREGGGFPLPSTGSDVGGPAPNPGGGGGVPDRPSLPSQQPSVEPLPAPQPPEAGDEPAAVDPALRLDGRRVAVEGRRVRFEIASASPGRLVLRLRHGKRLVAKGAEDLAQGGDATVALRLTRYGRRMLSDGRRRLTLVARFEDASGERIARRWKVVVRSSEEGRR